MGEFVARELASDYLTVSMLPTTGQARYFGKVAENGPRAGLELVPVAAGEPRDPLGAELAGVGRGDFLLPLSRAAAQAGVRAWLEAIHPRADEAPDVAVRVERVEPLRLLGGPK